jgi:hypothetical protein
MPRMGRMGFSAYFLRKYIYFIINKYKNCVALEKHFCRKLFDFGTAGKIYQHASRIAKM